MKRRLFNLAAGVSLVFFIASIALWVRGRITWKNEGVYLNTRGDTRERHYSATTGPFGIKASHHRLSGPPRLRDLGWHLFSTVNGAPDVGTLNRWYAEAGMTGAAGVWWYAGTPRSDGAGRMYELFVPHWFTAATTCVLPLVWFGGRHRRRRRRAHGHCPTCGYDRRATPDRCPECGAISEPPHNPPMQRTATASSGAVESNWRGRRGGR